MPKMVVPGRAPVTQTFAALAQTFNRWGNLVVPEATISQYCDVQALQQAVAQLEFNKASWDVDHIAVARLCYRGFARCFSDPAESILAQLKNPGLAEFVKRLSGEDRFLERCQVHKMQTGAGLHAHAHDPQDIAAIFHLNKGYLGGEYFEERGGHRSYPHIPPFSLFISRGGIIHGVEPVTHGERIVIVTSWDKKLQLQ